MMHLPFISAWLQRRRNTERERGVAFANKLIVRDGPAGIEVLKTGTEMSRVFGTFSEFDKGVEDVLQSYLEFEEL